MGPQKLTKILAPLVVIVFSLSLTVSIFHRSPEQPFPALSQIRLAV